MVRDAWGVISPGALDPVTPLPGFDGRVALAIAGDDIFALLGIGTAGKTLVRLEAGGWERVQGESEAGMVTERPWDGVIGLGDDAALTWSNGSEVIVQPIGETGEMLRARTQTPVGVMSVGRQVIATALPPKLTGAAYLGEAKLWLVRPGQLMELPTIKDVSAGMKALPFGDEALILMAVSESGQALDGIVVGVDGGVQYRGAVKMATLFASAELQLLFLLLGSIGLMVLMYVLRPERVVSAPVSFPTGMALADPLRRIMAATMDGSLAILVIAMVWSTGDMNLMTAPLEAVVTKLGIWPLVAAMGFSALHMGIAEAIFGTTIGKAMVGCRTVDRKGERLGVGWAFARSAAKAVCPALALFVIANPSIPHPGAFGSYTVLREIERKDESNASK